jgi:hypothetical protein
LGFGPVWCNLLFKLLRSCSTRVLVNGEPDDLILHQRGLRYGEPLSPMLFILVMDVLNSLVMKASQQGLLQPLMGGGRGQRISVYADDVVRKEESLQCHSLNLMFFTCNLRKGTFAEVCDQPRSLTKYLENVPYQRKFGRLWPQEKQHMQLSSVSLQIFGVL